MNDYCKVIIGEVIIMLLAVSLGFVLAGAYHSSKLTEHQIYYTVELENVLDICRNNYYQDYMLQENDTHMVIVFEDQGVLP